MKLSDSSECPVCGERLVKSIQVNLCGNCVHDLRSNGALPVQTTGEFGAMTSHQAHDMATRDAMRRPRSFTGDQSIRCSWCNKNRESVKKILSGETAHICNECVALCADILEADTPGWR